MATSISRPVIEAVKALPPWLQPFSSMRHRDFALLWLTQFGTGAGMWMEMIAHSWLVYEMTRLTESGLLTLVRYKQILRVLSHRNYRHLTGGK